MLSKNFFLVMLIYLTNVNSEKYTTKYDNINIEEILHSDRLLKNYLNCLMERGPCTSDAQELKKILPEALATNCMNCSEKQKEASKKVIAHLYHNKKDWWQELQKKYDPDNVYFERNKDKLDKLR